jgi:hypothetical protein
MEVCHKPRGGGYAERRVLAADALIAPLWAPQQRLTVRALLPWDRLTASGEISTGSLPLG